MFVNSVLFPRVNPFLVVLVFGGGGVGVVEEEAPLPIPFTHIPELEQMEAFRGVSARVSKEKTPTAIVFLVGKILSTLLDM